MLTYLISITFYIKPSSLSRFSVNLVLVLFGKTYTEEWFSFFLTELFPLTVDIQYHCVLLLLVRSCLFTGRNEKTPGTVSQVSQVLAGVPLTCRFPWTLQSLLASITSNNHTEQIPNTVQLSLCKN